MHFIQHEVTAKIK